MAAARDVIVATVSVLALVSAATVSACPPECTCEGTAIDCSYRRLTTVPTAIPPTTHRL